MLSSFAVDNHAQGTAFVHNLIAGVVRPRKILTRDTPYHFPHSTQVYGFSPVFGGDDRVINNIFLGIREGWGEYPKYTGNFCKIYDVYSTPEEYPERLRGAGSRHATPTYADTPQSVWIEGNAYAGFAGAFREEKGAVRIDGAEVTLEQNGDACVLTLSVPESISEAKCSPVTTASLRMPRLTEQPYELPDGTPVDFSASTKPGPFASLVSGKQSFVVWRA